MLSFFILIYKHLINSKIEIIRTNNTDDRKVYDLSKAEVLNRGLEFIDDQRFIKFIKSEKKHLILKF